MASVCGERRFVEKRPCKCFPKDIRPYFSWKRRRQPWLQIDLDLPCSPQEQVFLLPYQPHTHSKKKMVSSGSQCTSPLWCPVSIISWNSGMRGFGLYCESQIKIRSKPRGWRGKGTLCRLWCSREVQPLFESWFEGVDCHSSWLLTAVSHHKPTWHQREKDEQENGSLNVCVATVLALVLISPLCVCELPNQDAHMTHGMSGGREIPHSTAFLTCPFEIPLKPAVWSKFLNIFHAGCTPQRASLCLHSPWWCLSQFPAFTEREGQILMQITHLCQSWWGYPSVCHLGI